MNEYEKGVRVMKPWVKASSRKSGLPPGTLVYVGVPKTEKVRIAITNYDRTDLQERTVEHPSECTIFRDRPGVTWVHVRGLHQPDIVEETGRCYGLHDLLLEDVLNTGQRPKIEEYEECLFLVLKVISVRGPQRELLVEHVSIVLGSDFVLSFQEGEHDLFEPVRDRIRKGKGRIRSKGPDYLAYALMDVIVDQYFQVLDALGGRIEDIEEELISDPSSETLQDIHRLRREVLFLDKSVWPLREVVAGLERETPPYVQEETRPYLRDLHDHTVQVVEILEMFRDMASNTLEIYLSSLSNKMNEVMKVLALFAAIFIPLTFLAGIYGMNFKHMPELEWSFGYPMVWIVNVLVGLAMLFFFRRNKWL